MMTFTNDLPHYSYATLTRGRCHALRSAIKNTLKTIQEAWEDSTFR